MAWGKHRSLSKEKHREYQLVFPTSDERRGLLAFRDTLLDFKKPCWGMAKELPKLNRLPIHLAWGMKDPLISHRNLDRWISLYPDAKVSRFEHVGHFVADEGQELLTQEL